MSDKPVSPLSPGEVMTETYRCMEHWQENCEDCSGPALVCKTCGQVACVHLQSEVRRLLRELSEERERCEALVAACASLPTSLKLTPEKLASIIVAIDKCKTAWTNEASSRGLTHDKETP